MARTKNGRAPHQQIHQSKKNDWYTPAVYIEAVRAVLGGIDIDPASCAFANETVQASRFFSIEDDGLRHDWPGRVFLNPPYGKTGGKSNAALWSAKLTEQVVRGITTEAILLVNANIGSVWFMPLLRRPVCFVSRRIHFYDEDGRSSQPTNGNAFVYFGTNADRFAYHFCQFGAVMTLHPFCKGEQL